MLIAIDGNEANVRNKVGVSVYTFELLHYFQKKANEDLQFRIYLREPNLSNLPKETRYFKYKIVPGTFAWSRIFLPFRLYRDAYSKFKPALFFSPAHYAPKFNPFSLVVTIHDLSFLQFPDEFLKKDLYKLKHWTEESIKNARKIIAVSKTTKKDILRYYDVDEDKIQIIYNGYDSSAKKIDTAIFKRLSLQDENYFLYVGTLQPRKNLAFLVKAFAKLKQSNTDKKLVIVGKKGWLYDEIFAEVQQQELQEQVVFTGFVTDEEKNALYKNAFCFIHPSLYEGFGIPLLEAMSFGCPVISSHASSLPEIGGEACLYFDPNDEGDLLDKIQRLTNSHALRSQLIQKGKERIKEFSWQKTGEETLEALKEIARSN